MSLKCDEIIQSSNVKKQNKTLSNKTHKTKHKTWFVFFKGEIISLLSEVQLYHCVWLASYCRAGPLWSGGTTACDGSRTNCLLYLLDSATTSCKM